MQTDTEQFANALKKADLALLASVPKADLHNHGLLAAKLEHYGKLTGIPLEPPPARMHAFDEMGAWIDRNLGAEFHTAAGFAHIWTGMFQQAAADGIARLEASIDVSYHRFFPGGTEEMIQVLRNAHQEHAPDTNFRPEIGVARNYYSPEQALEWMEMYADTGYFHSLDAYDVETEESVDLYKPLFRAGKKRGLKLKGHYGEYGNADLVRRAVEELELEAVQHGIAAAESLEVMQWLADNSITLNVCPSSNVSLCRAESIAKHPIRKLFDHGVRVTVNTDDIAVFGKSVSDEFMALYQEKVFSVDELEKIRQWGLDGRSNMLEL